MRQIKFRAYTGDTMYYPKDYIKEYRQFDLEESCRLYFLPMSCIMGDCNDWIWMQSTGLKDINGKEIYEDDILQEHYRTNPKRVVVTVGSDGMWLCGYSWSSLYHILSHPGVTVIGNIYENPELLEG